ncbi:MAG: porphobilinogen synthase [Euryarchaeota archaeon]|nr:porphobilinogen synthase [Euryarchaeota archaeon]
MASRHIRPRRLRSTPLLRNLVAESEVRAGHLIYPLFVDETLRTPAAIRSMPGQFRWPLERVGGVAARARRLGVPGVILFGVPRRKDPLGSGAYDPRGVIQRAIPRLRRAAPGLAVITDVCLCEYTSHGHCGLVKGGKILNDPTLDFYARVAVSHAEAGATLVAPSGMMDHQVAAIRRGLDDAGFPETPILSYAAKYASAFYGPFREAAGSRPAWGDRRGHQMDPRNWREAIREVSLDLEEGADMVMVKPAMPCLDVIARVKDTLRVPVAAFQVSGEYAMLRAAQRWGGPDVVRESLGAIRRAGADLILSYFALDAARR